jgi:hypothetical protein
VGSASSSSSTSPFEASVLNWHTAARAPFAGLRRVGESDVEQMHFSWMVELLPYLNHREAYNRFRFDKPLTEGTNMRAATQVIPEFLMPGDDRKTWKGYPFPGLGLTHFAGMSGVEDSRNVVAAKLPRSDPRAGVFGYKEVAKASEITDGTSQTIMIVGSGKLANPWAMGGGATIRGAREPYFDNLSGLGTKGPSGGSVVVMADGSVRHVSSNVDPKVFRAMCTIHGAESFDLEQAAPRSSIK